MGVTSPDNIYSHDGTGPASLVTVSQTMASSIQTAFNKRERYDFVWANSAERTAETGMVQGSRGYQIDTKTEYQYDNSNWRLATSYAEYNQSIVQAIPNITETSITNLAYVTANSTDSTFTSVNTTTGLITLVNPGIYSMSLVIGMSGGVGATHYAALRPDNTGTLPPLSGSGFNAGSTTVALPFLRTTVSNYTLYPRMYQSSGGASNTLYVILRIGRIA